ncbi:MAG: alkaline phosphatase D family protein [Prochloron sp. SP5CPC1]|nr:alkaline phosphatase D family protein [Candidatus Paraprochloron terpiosi SP5CPC1]
MEDAPTQLWYSFRDGCCDFFMADTRTERQLSEVSEERKIISDEQMLALQKWLVDGSGRIKLIASGVPFFPDFKTKNTDKWNGFLHQRTVLLDFIAEQQISPVIFLSGDVHCSMTAELRCPQQPNFKIISVISSAFFWPYPHNQGSSFQLEGILESNSERTYEVIHGGPVHSTDNFTRVTIDPTSLKAEVFSRTGELCGTKIHSF